MRVSNEERVFHSNVMNPMHITTSQQLRLLTDLRKDVKVRSFASNNDCWIVAVAFIVSGTDTTSRPDWRIRNGKFSQEIQSQ